MIEVKKRTDNEFLVTVSDEGTRTEHIVTLDDAYYEDLTGGKITREELIKRAFQFLLERESNQSILSKFNLKVINTYFPEFEHEIRLNK